MRADNIFKWLWGVAQISKHLKNHAETPEIMKEWKHTAALTTIRRTLAESFDQINRFQHLRNS